MILGALGRDLLEYPVTVDGVLGLWSLILGGTKTGTRDAQQQRDSG